MSKYNRTTIMFLSLVSILLATENAGEHKVQTAAGRGLASSEKRAPTQKTMRFRHTQKVRGPLSTSIEILDEVPKTADQTFTLKGSVQSDKDLSDVSFTWALPDNVELVSGARTGTIANLQKDLPVQIQITLKTKSAQNHQIHLSVGGKFKNAHFGDVAQFNTALPVDADNSKGLFKASQEAPQSKDKKMRGKKILD